MATVSHIQILQIALIILGAAFVVCELRPSVVFSQVRLPVNRRPSTGGLLSPNSRVTLSPISQVSGKSACKGIFQTEDDSRVVVACVGDSITHGNGTLRKKLSFYEGNYPKRLMQIISETCSSSKSERLVVANFGHSGRTARPGFTQSYFNSPFYKSAMTSDPNIVIILLGTVDSKPKYWAGAAVFKESLEQLIEQFATLASRPRIVLMTPPPAFVNPKTIDTKRMVFDEVDADVIAAEIVPTVRHLAAERGFPLIELYDEFTRIPGLLVHGARLKDKSIASSELLDDALFVMKYFHDGVHPSRLSHDIIAERVFDTISKMR